MPSPAGMLLAASGFAVWAFFSILPLLLGGPGIREAWDISLYWMIGVPFLCLAVAAAGYATREPVWQLALWPIAGHALGMLLVHKAGTSLALLPVAILFIGIPAFLIFAALARLGRAFAPAGTR